MLGGEDLDIHQQTQQGAPRISTQQQIQLNETQTRQQPDVSNRQLNLQGVAQQSHPDHHQQQQPDVRQPPPTTPPTTGTGQRFHGTVLDRIVKRGKWKSEVASWEMVELDGIGLENVIEFDYLGNKLDAQGEVMVSVSDRISKARQRFYSLLNVWRSRKLSVDLRVRLLMWLLVCSTGLRVG